MKERTQKPEWGQVIIDGAEMAGSNSVFSALVGQTMYKRSQEALVKLTEPGILAINFARIGMVDSSTLMIVVAKLLALSQKNKWRKTVVCLNTTEHHQGSLTRSITHYPYVNDDWEESRRLLLLVSGCGNADLWCLLGELTPEERILWDLIAETTYITITGLAARSSLQEQIVTSNLRVFFDNRVLVKSEDEEQVSLYPVFSLLTI